MANWVCQNCGNDNSVEFKICELCGMPASSEDINKAMEQEKADLQRESEEQEKNNTYDEAVHLMLKNTTEDCERAINLFNTILDWKDAYEQKNKCESIVEQKELEEIYNSAEQFMLNDTEDDYIKAMKLFDQILDFKDSKEKMGVCFCKIEDLIEEKAFSKQQQKKNRNIAKALVIVLLLPIIVLGLIMILTAIR